MIPAASSAGYAVKTVQPVTHSAAARAAQPAQPEAERSSAGEASAANVTLHSAKAVTAPEQAAVAPRLREQETAEQTDRAPVAKDAPTGPPPSFEESPLERQARVAFDPPETAPEPAFDLRPGLVVKETSDTETEEKAELKTPETAPDPPPTSTERAEASFAETRTISASKQPAQVDLGL